MQSSVQLPLELQTNVIGRLPPNEQALAGRLVSRGLGIHLGNCTARFRQPLPPSAGDAAWRPHLHQAFKQLTFNNKLAMLSAAAASGSEANLEVAWGLLRPCLHPDMLLQPQGYRETYTYGDSAMVHYPDPGTAAVMAGHAATVLPWLVRHGCPLFPDDTLQAAAQHCDLAGLQAACQLLGYGPDALKDNDSSLTRAAGRSGGDGAIAKLTWLWLVALKSTWQKHHEQLMVAAATGAAESGSLPVLTWLRGLGLGMADGDRLNGVKAWAQVLGAALRGGHVAVADWLVDEAGCPLPSDETQDKAADVWDEAASGGHVECLRWLLRRGVPVHAWSVLPAAEAGRLEAVRFLHTECGAQLTEEGMFVDAAGKELFVKAAGSGSLPTAALLLQAGCPMDSDAYCQAAEAGDADTVVWLAQEAGCPWDEGTLYRVIAGWTEALSSRPGLRRAVEVLLAAGCKPANDVASSCAAAAAKHGDLVLLRRLHGELGVAPGRLTLALAAEGGCEAVLQWVVGQELEEEEEEGEWDEEDLDPFARAGGHGDMATLECLQRLGVALQPRVVKSAALCEAPLPVLRWLLERGAPWDEETKRGILVLLNHRYPASQAWILSRLGRGRDGQ